MLVLDVKIGIIITWQCVSGHTVSADRSLPNSKMTYKTTMITENLKETTMKLAS